jgi:hypothetical protein
MKNPIHGWKFRDDDEFIEQMKTWLQQTTEDFDQQGMTALVSVCRTAVENTKTTQKVSACK